MNIERRYVDDFEIEYGGYEMPETTNHLKTYNDLMDREQIHEIRLNAKKFLKSDADIVSMQSGIISLDNSQDGLEHIMNKVPNNKKFSLYLEIRNVMKRALVENSLMKKLYPSLKIQKPGQEYY